MPQDGARGLKADAVAGLGPGPAARPIREGQKRLPALRSLYPTLLALLSAVPRPTATGAALVRVMRRLNAYDLLAKWAPGPWHRGLRAAAIVACVMLSVTMLGLVHLG